MSLSAASVNLYLLRMYAMVAFSTLSYVELPDGRAASKICLASCMLTTTFFAPLVALLAAKIISLSYFFPPTVIVLDKLFCALMRFRTPVVVAFVAFMVFIAFLATMATNADEKEGTR